MIEMIRPSDNQLNRLYMEMVGRDELHSMFNDSELTLNQFKRFINGCDAIWFMVDDLNHIKFLSYASESVHHEATLSLWMRNSNKTNIIFLASIIESLIRDGKHIFIDSVVDAHTQLYIKCGFTLDGGIDDIVFLTIEADDWYKSKLRSIAVQIGKGII